MPLLVKDANTLTSENQQLNVITSDAAFYIFISMYKPMLVLLNVPDTCTFCKGSSNHHVSRANPGTRSKDLGTKCIKCVAEVYIHT